MHINGMYPSIASGFGNFMTPFGGVYQIVPYFVLSQNEENKYDTLS